MNEKQKDPKKVDITPRPKRRRKSSREVEIDGENIAELIIRVRDPRNEPCPGKILYIEKNIDENDLSNIMSLLNVPRKLQAKIMNVTYEDTLDLDTLYNLFVIRKLTPGKIASELSTDEETIINELIEKHFIPKGHKF